MTQTGRMRSVDSTRFSMVSRPDVPRSAFDVQFGHKTTINAAELVPVYVDEVLPGDSLRLSMNAFCRLSTPIVPLLDNLEFETFFFYVPNRLVWSNWQRFMGEQASPTDTTSFLVPQCDIINAELVNTQLADYFGLTLNGSGNTLHVNALPFRAYNLIWNEWFRDEDLQSKIAVPLGDGPDTPTGTGYFLQPRGKRHDYFTSARPWPQKPINMGIIPDATGLSAGALGNGLVGFGGFQGSNTTPLGGVGAPVTGIGAVTAASGGPLAARVSGTRAQSFDNYFNPNDMRYQAQTIGVGGGDYPDIRVLVNDLRTATLVQLMLERNARGGTRYTELLRSHFGVTSPDARLQRPEYLGGGRTMIQVNPVAQTSASGVAGTTTKLGELAAVATGMVHGHGFSQSFVEHGYIIGLANVRSYLTYQQGNNRMWYRRTQYDFYWPGLAHLGEQAILSEELYADGSASDVTVFGYQERWSEYKYKPSMTSGYFRSTNATPLDMWHLGQKFVGRPVLNNLFIQEDPPIARVLQVATNYGEQFLLDMLFDCRWTRCMPMYSIPGVGARL